MQPKQLFLRAEGALLGWEMVVPSKQFYEQGVQLSFEERGAGSAEQYPQDSQSKPASHVEPANGYGTNTMAASQVTIAWDDNATNDVKLEKIITQKWLALLPQWPRRLGRCTPYRITAITANGIYPRLRHRYPQPYTLPSSTERINNPRRVSANGFPSSVARTTMLQRCGGKTLTHNLNR